jgi:hypothetical protein
MRVVGLAFVVALSTFVLSAQTALAGRPSNGEGWWGVTTDKTTTGAGFILIIAFPLLVAFLSFVQGRLEKRKQARMQAKKARLARADLRGGW